MELPDLEGSDQDEEIMLIEESDDVLDNNVATRRVAPPPQWVVEVCRRRSKFESTLLRFNAGGVEHFVLFLFARMSPS